MVEEHDHKPAPFLRSPGGLVLIAFLAIAGFFLWQEHRAHLLGVLPYLLVGSAAARRNPARLFLAGCAIMMGGILLRINGFLIGYDTGLGVDHGWNYFPSIAEMLVTIGMFAVEVLAYIIITRRFPVLPREGAAH